METLFIRLIKHLQNKQRNNMNKKYGKSKHPKRARTFCQFQSFTQHIVINTQFITPLNKNSNCSVQDLSRKRNCQFHPSSTAVTLKFEKKVTVTGMKALGLMEDIKVQSLEDLT